MPKVARVLSAEGHVDSASQRLPRKCKFIPKRQERKNLPTVIYSSTCRLRRWSRLPHTLLSWSDIDMPNKFKIVRKKTQRKQQNHD